MKNAIISTFLFALVFAFIYPLSSFLLGSLLFREQANGSLIFDKEKKVIGSILIAQNFTKPYYFHPRPSMANYDAANSRASNLAPTSKTLMDQVEERANNYRALNNISPTFLVPIDAVTASASGLDPEISLENALLQLSRVAKARNLKEEIILNIIQKHTRYVLFNAPSQIIVNIMLLNSELDKLYPYGSTAKD